MVGDEVSLGVLVKLSVASRPAMPCRGSETVTLFLSVSARIVTGWLEVDLVADRVARVAENLEAVVDEGGKLISIASRYSARCLPGASRT